MPRKADHSQTSSAHVPRQTEPPEPASGVAAIGVRDQARALNNLAAIAQLAPPEVYEALPNLLADSHDPDTALNLFERLSRGASPELLQLLRRRTFLVHYALVIFADSPYLGDTLIRNPEVFEALAKKGVLDRSLTVEDYRQAFAEWKSVRRDDDLPLLLAEFKRRAFVPLLLRDVLGLGTLGEITGELSALADALITEALHGAEQQMSSRYGALRRPDGSLPFAVLGLGKLGGNELNYSSDVDLLYVYDDEAPPAASISAREYFVRLAQLITELLSRNTVEGPPYRIDLRLRPQGREGEPAIGIGAALRYYREVAHDWELQAMIKARYVAGDETIAEQLTRGVQPLVYKRALNFAAIETALAGRRRMAQRRPGGLWARSGRSGLDVKVGRGGIRDIEFLAQCLQRVYGGSEPWLRSSGTLFALQKLHDKGHLSGNDFHHLSNGYEFLRRLEHRLQMRHGQQTHRLPEGRSEREFLFRALGGDRGQKNAAEQLEAMVATRMQAVAEIYNRIIHHQRAQEAAPRLVLTSASGTGHSFEQLLSRFAAEAPEIHRLARGRAVTPHARRNLQRFLASAITDATRFSVVAQNPAALERAIALFENSEFLTDLLIRYPEELAFLSLPDWSADNSAELSESRTQRNGPAPVKRTKTAEPLDWIRQEFRRRTFRSGVRDVLEGRNVFESLSESTDTAESAITEALEFAEAPTGMAILALGRLGSCEFDIGSDADLLFVRNQSTSAASATRAAERVVHVLAAYTRAGTVFSVDSRLRPRGNEGDLVVTPKQLERYFATEAQPWEALTYTKLRHVAGSVHTSQAAIDAVRSCFEKFTADRDFVVKLRAMRKRLEESDRERNLKTIAGGLYDIDFIVGERLIRAGEFQTRGNLRDVLAYLATRGLLSETDHAAALSAAELFLTAEHCIRLVQGRPQKWLPAAERPRAAVQRLARSKLPVLSSGDLESALLSSFAQVRALYDRLLPAA